VTSGSESSSVVFPWSAGVNRGLEFLWLLTVLLVPLIFVTPGLMASGFDVPKVTLYRSLVGLMCALWMIERGMNSCRFSA